MKKLLACSAAAAALALWTSHASAATIDLGYYNGSSITQFASGSTGTLVSGSATYGDFSITASASGSGTPGALNSNTIDILSSGSGTLIVYATLVGVTSPVSTAVTWLSDFTSNALPAGWSVTEATYLDPADGAYALTDELSSTTFSATGATTISYGLDPGAGPYSLTEVFTITASGPSETGANSTIDLSGTTPLPAALPLFIGGLGVFGFAGLRKSKKQRTTI